AIRSVPGHEHDWVVPAAVAPFNTETTYSGNRTGDWVRYFADMLFQINIQEGSADALALHAYTHGSSAALVSNDAQAPRHSGRHWHFRVLRDFLAAVTPSMRRLPVLVTSASPAEPGWSDHEEGWIQAACAEVEQWNSGPENQGIQALCLRRWRALPGDPPGFGISEKSAVVDDLCRALEKNYRVRWPGLAPTPDYCARWVSGLQPPSQAVAPSVILTGAVVVRNAGALPWLASGPHALHLEYEWLDQREQALPSDWVDDGAKLPLPGDVLPGQTLRIDNVQVRAPRIGGDYVCRLDLVRPGGLGLRQVGSPTLDLAVSVQAPPYAAEWLGLPDLPRRELTRETTWTGPIRVRNLGASTWHSEGPLAIRLGCAWRGRDAGEVLPPPDPHGFAMAVDTMPGDTAVFPDVVLSGPASEGSYTVQWDLYEGPVPLSTRGISPFEQPLNVVPPIPPFAAAWSVGHALPAQLEPNEDALLDLTVTNTGRDNWGKSADAAVRLIWKWMDAADQPLEGSAYSGERTIDQETPPAHAWQIERLGIRAPVPQGEYRFVLDLLKPDEGLLSSCGGEALVQAVTVKSQAPPESVEWLSQPELPQPALVAGSIIAGSLSFKNTGSEILASSIQSGKRLCYRWLDAAGQSAGSGAFPLENKVLPRETATVAVELQVPQAPGRYLLAYYLADDPGANVTQLLAAPAATAIVRLPQIEREAEYLGHDLPANVSAGSQFSASVRVRNIGRTVWSCDGDTCVSMRARWFDILSGEQIEPVTESPLQEEIRREEEHAFTLDLEVPDKEGLYRLEFDMVTEGGRSFSEEGRQGLSLRIRVTDQPSVANLWRARASHNSFQAFSAIDGDPGTAWSSIEPQAEGMWFEIDLGGPRMLDGALLRSPGAGYPRGYELSVSEDGSLWRTLAVLQEGNEQDVYGLFAPAIMRFIRIALLAPAPGAWRISEVQVHESGLWQATASVNGESAGLAIDNDPGTCWTTGELGLKENTWFQVDLGDPARVAGVTLIGPPGELAPALDVSAWREPEGGWLMVAEARGDAVPRAVKFAPILTRYLHLSSKGESNRPWSIAEIKIHRESPGWISNW
ncbi:MAG: discoidin domain-containing protein, partial [Rudaea sp.]